MNEIVVAHYNEDCSWVKNIPSGWKAFIYHKGIDLPNVGREPSTFLHHIVEHYDELPGVTVFVQGNPFDHTPGLLSTLSRISEKGFYELSFELEFAWLGNTDYFSNEDASPYDNRPVKTVADSLGVIVNEWPIYFARGGQFAVTRQAVHSRPREWYAQALKVCNEVDGAPWCFERLWQKIFDGD